MSKYLVDKSTDEIILEIEKIGKAADREGNISLKWVVFAILLDEYLTGKGKINAIWRTEDPFGHRVNSVQTDFVYLTTGNGQQDMYIGVHVYQLTRNTAITLAKSAAFAKNVYRADFSFDVPSKNRLWIALSRIVSKDHAIRCLWRLNDWQLLAKELNSKWGNL